MAQDSKIEWTKHTANLWWGCTKVHEGCDHCYAETLDNRYNNANTHWGNDKPRKAVISVWNDFKKYQDAAANAGEIHRVFVGSMMDIFEKSMPLENPIAIHAKYAGKSIGLIDNTGSLRDAFFLYVVPSCPNLQFLLLTKRPSNINRFIPESWKVTPPANVIFGTSPVNQETANKLIPQLLEVKGRHFLSVEPQLGPVSLMPWMSTPGWSPTYNDPDNAGMAPMSEPTNEFIDWVIVGGESGAGKRPFDTDWGRQIKHECEVSNTPFFFKQIDKVQEIPEDLMIRQFPN